MLEGIYTNFDSTILLALSQWMHTGGQVEASWPLVRRRDAASNSIQTTNLTSLAASTRAHLAAGSHFKALSLAWLCIEAYANFELFPVYKLELSLLRYSGRV